VDGGFSYINPKSHFSDASASVNTTDMDSLTVPRLFISGSDWQDSVIPTATSLAGKT